ncbi:MAG: hypothetical protein CMQ24_11380 [Gammaproteobacteria bacterium]|nr:hypothetical protein [Gammaproteobacteria bacterium]
MEFWTSTVAAPTRAAGFAAKAQALGWDGMGVVDSQNLSGDPYVSLAMAGAGTSTLGLMTSVSNPVTRHAAATACSALSVNKVSRGRMVLGIGRGDSALAHLGHAPARLNWFETYLAQVQCYLHGEAVPFSETSIPAVAAPLVSDLELADAPAESSISWVRDGDAVPVEVAATGAKVIGIAARHADRILFALGAVPERLQWGIETARAAAEAAGRDPASLRFGAYVNVVCDDDLIRARQLARAGTSLFARFSVMHGKVNGPVDAAQADVLQTIHDTYDMNKHAQAGGEQTKALTDEFLDSYAILGGAATCIERLGVLARLGIDKCVVSGPNLAARGPGEDAATRFIEDVAPALRA